MPHGSARSGMVTEILHHTRDENGVVHARILDLVPGQSGKVYADWLKTRGPEFTAGIKATALDPFRQIGAEHLTDKQTARLDAKLTFGDPDHEVTLDWQCYKKLRNMHHARPERGRELVNEVIASFLSCPIPEVSRLGSTLKLWKAASLAYFDTSGASNGSTEAINGVTETTRINRPGLPQLHQLQTQMPTRLRPPPLPNQTEQLCLNAKSHFGTQDTRRPPPCGADF